MSSWTAEVEEKLAQNLAQGLAELDLALPETTQQKLLDYLALFAKWNKVYNLSAIREPQEMLVKHLLDSLAVVKYVEADRLLDVGTGGGLPGIPLALAKPEMQISLLDSNAKKTRFLVQAKGQLGLDNVIVVNERVESHLVEPLYDGIISRAFSSIKDMVDLTEHLLAPQGKWWALKSQGLREELEELPAQVGVVQSWNLQVPYLDAARNLVCLSRSQRVQS